MPDPSNPPSGCSFHPRCPRVVPPEDYDFPQDSFREVLDFRLDVESGDVDDDLSTAADVRDEYGIPPELPDGDADAVLSAAIDEVLAGDTEAAAERLGDAFSTVCEREAPELGETDAGHPAACHLHGVASEHAPPELASDD